ncbi:hypothetical protein AKJ16_DCAP13181 [Drosera capensis]
MAMGSPSLQKVLFACGAITVMLMAIGAMVPSTDAAMYILNPNPCYYCRDCIANGAKASLLSWGACCPGLNDLANALATSKATLCDKQMACVGMSQYVSEIPGYSYANTQAMLSHCQTKNYPFALSSSANCSRPLGYQQHKPSIRQYDMCALDSTLAAPKP